MTEAQRNEIRWLNDHEKIVVDYKIIFISDLFRELEVELRANEREACAKVADDLSKHHDFYDGGYEVGRKIVQAIRSRK